MTAHVLDLELEALLRAPLGALEGEVLEEVSGTVILLRLVGAAGVDEHADAAGLARSGLAGDRQAVLERGDLRLRSIEQILREFVVGAQGGVALLQAVSGRNKLCHDGAVQLCDTRTHRYSLHAPRTSLQCGR